MYISHNVYRAYIIRIGCSLDLLVYFGYLSATVTSTLESTLSPHSAVNEGLNDLQEMQLLLIRPVGKCMRMRDITVH